MKEYKRKFWFSIALTIPVLLLSDTVQEWLGLAWIRVPYQPEVLLILSLAIYAYGGLPFLRGMIQELKQLQPGMMTLIGTAMSVAFFYSAATVLVIAGKDFFWELATLTDIMLLGHWVEARSVLGASTALEELVRIMPTTAHVMNDSRVEDKPVSELKKGDIVLVRPGEKVPSDGVVLEGESDVNEAFLTGESTPVHKQSGDKATGGSINGGGALTVRIERTGEETYLSQVVKLVRQAQESRSRTQDLANRAAALLFYVAVFVAVLTYAVWAVAGQYDAALERTVTVLVIACPHALGLAIPLVVALSTSITAKSGILIRDRKAFEDVKSVDSFVFDKTGTLTQGKFGVTDVVSFVPQEELLKLTASVEFSSEHIIAKAIVDYAEKRRIEFPRADEFKAVPGKGACGKVEGKNVCVGNLALLRDLRVDPVDQKINNLQQQGKTVVFTVVDGKLAGAIALSDVIRKESVEAIQKLKDMGAKVYMLTGDSEKVARTVAAELGIDEYFAEVLPDKKAEKIKLLKENHQKVGMVGDGINDAPALVTADVGIAIGAGTDVAIESADIVLVRSDPRDIAKVVDLSRKTYSKMVQNLWWATGYNIVAIPLAAGVLSGFGVVLNPAAGAILMSLSTVIVALNAQTLRKYGPKGGGSVEKKQTVIDPVCGMEIELASATHVIEFEGQKVYFCSNNCEERFKENPQKYVGKVRREAAKR